MSYIYAISDIHGRYDLLEEMVRERLHFEIGDVLVLLGDYVDGGDSYTTLEKIYQLQKLYPQQVIVLMGNHEEWLLSFLRNRPSRLSAQIQQNFQTLESFIGEEEFTRIYQHSAQHYQERYSFLEDMYQQCRKQICQKYGYLIEWLEKLPYYYESAYQQIFVHAGIEVVLGFEEAWKDLSDENIFCMKYPPEKGSFYKTVIAGHVGTHQIVNDPTFHRICRLGDFIYLDSSVAQSQHLNLLAFHCQTYQYQGWIKEKGQWISYDIPSLL